MENISENTRFRIWGKCLSSLGKLCSKKKGVLVCGNVKHKHLGRDGESTAAAAAYPQALCEAYAEAITKDSDAEETPGSSEEDLPAGVKGDDPTGAPVNRTCRESSGSCISRESAKTHLQRRGPGRTERAQTERR